jgi:hypothetical protein
LASINDYMDWGRNTFYFTYHFSMRSEITLISAKINKSWRMS